MMIPDKISLDRIEKLHPYIRSEVRNLFIKSQGLLPEGIMLRVTQGLRTFQEQNILYSKGRTTKGHIVTNAQAGYSYHNYGLAIDLCYIINGKAVWRVDRYYKKIVELFKSRGYNWGGDFTTLVDNPHFEKSFGISVKILLDRYNRKEFINGTYYIDLWEKQYS